jgi:toxin-antitoxin system PIN domain toxin
VILPDVNVLVYAHREDTPDHAAYRAWLESVINGEQAYGMCDLVLSGFVRVVTHPRIFDQPSGLDQALAFVADVRNQPNCVHVRPGARHWSIFEHLCRIANVKGNLVPDAYLVLLPYLVRAAHQSAHCISSLRAKLARIAIRSRLVERKIGPIRRSTVAVLESMAAARNQ